MPHIPEVSAVSAAQTAPAVSAVNAVVHPPPKVLVIGGVAVDVSCDMAAANPGLHTSNPSRITESLGGVANNVAYAMHLSGTPTRLVSSIGNDLSGRWIKEQVQARGMDTSGLAVSATHGTARYIAFNNAAGDLFVSTADMNAISAMSPVDLIETITAANTSWVVIDGNLGAETTTELLNHCRKAGIKGVPCPSHPYFPYQRLRSNF